MRVLLAIPLLLTGACNVVSDPSNDQVTVQYNEEAAQDAASDAGNTAEGIGSAIVNEANETADRVDNSGIVADGETNTAQNQQ